MTSVFVVLVSVATLAAYALGAQPEPKKAGGHRGAPLVNGQDLRLVELHETTTWPFLEDCYNSHNAYRQLHKVGEVKMNRTLVDYARLKALIYAWYDGDAPQEKDPNMFGENHAWSAAATGPVNCTEVVSGWYNTQVGAWDYDSSLLDDSNRDFAQIVWKRTRRFGCGQALSRGARGGVHTVCYYDPTAETGKERENVLRPTPVTTTTTTTAAPTDASTTQAAQQQEQSQSQSQA